MTKVKRVFARCDNSEEGFYLLWQQSKCFLRVVTTVKRVYARCDNNEEGFGGFCTVCQRLRDFFAV